MQQITTTLPASAWKDIPIKECGEELVLVRENPKLKLGYPEHIRGVKTGEEHQRSFLVRRSVDAKLRELTQYRLPSNIALVLIEGWRSMEHQKLVWERTCNIVQQANPDWTTEKVEQKARLYSAPPSRFANHHCGGAVDVTLAEKDTGILLDMGTPYPHAHSGEGIMELYPTDAEHVLAPHKENRRILREAMQAVGFANYPKEWWHYSFGDRMYAGYTKRAECIYGPVEPEPDQARY